MTKSINILDKDYSKWIQELSSRYRRSQIKAAVKVNQEMLQFYWELGRDIVERDAENKYGSGFYEMLSKDLKDAIPMTTGFSDRNLRYAKKFYSLYNEEFVKLQQVAAKSDEQNLQQVAAKTMSDIFSVPWGHHMLIIDKVKGNTEKAMFFVTKPLKTVGAEIFCLISLARSCMSDKARPLQTSNALCQKKPAIWPKN